MDINKKRKKLLINSSILYFLVYFICWSVYLLTSYELFPWVPMVLFALIFELYFMKDNSLENNGVPIVIKSNLDKFYYIGFLTVIVAYVLNFITMMFFY